MPQRDPERYTQGDDGLIVEKVGSWATEKLKLLTDCVYASGGARKRYLNTGAAYIDPFCGPGRSLIRNYAGEDYEQFDKFAPGWRGNISTNMRKARFRAEILKFWSDRVTALGLPQAKHCQMIRGDQGQHLYLLFLLSRHPLAHDLWAKISSAARSPTFDF